MSNRQNNLAEQRINMLLDDNSFMEVGSFITARKTDFNLSQVSEPSDGVITGHGLIDGRLVSVYSQDVSVLNGTIGEMHAKKITNIYNKAVQMGAPVIGILDCAGVRLQESVDALDAMGSIYAKMVEASGIIPQISAVFGQCGGGLSVIPSLSDFTFMESKKGKVFVNAPNALAGNYKEKLDTASAAFQGTETGLVDAEGTTEEILGEIRQLVSMLPSSNLEGGYMEECSDDLNRAVDNALGLKDDPRYLLSEISDDGVFFETKREYGKNMVTGFMKLNGVTVGAVANCACVFDEEGNKVETFDTVMSPEGCEKAAGFVGFCDAFDIPVISFANSAGFEATVTAEKYMGHALSRMTYAFASATVPKINLVTGVAYGSAYVTMNSKSVGADIVAAWTGAKLGVMDAKLAASIMFANESADVQKAEAAKFEELQGSVASAARRGSVDLIFEPEDTRKYLIASLEMLLSKNSEAAYKKHGCK